MTPTENCSLKRPDRPSFHQVSVISRNLQRPWHTSTNCSKTPTQLFGNNSSHTMTCLSSSSKSFAGKSNMISIIYWLMGTTLSSHVFGILLMIRSQRRGLSTLASLLAITIAYSSYLTEIAPNNLLPTLRRCMQLFALPPTTHLRTRN